MRFLIYILLFTSSNLFCSDLDTTKYAVPNIILDSLIFETVKGRACEKVLSAQANENQKLEFEILAQGKVIQLKNSEVSHLEEIILALQKQAEANIIIWREKWDRLKRIVRRLVFIVIGETGAVVLLVIVLL